MALILVAIPALPTPRPWQQQHPAEPQHESRPGDAPATPGHAAPAVSSEHPAPPPRSNGAPAVHSNGAGPHRGDWLRKYRSLPPSQQEQQLRRDPVFESLPPDKQNQLLERLRKFNSQPPQKQAQILKRMETFEHMTPQQQQAARSLFERYRNLPEDQKDKVSQAYRRLRGMPPSARNELLNSDEFKNNFSDDERDLLRGMAELRVNPGH